MRAKAPWSRSKPEQKRWILLRLLKGFTNGFSTSARLVNVTVRSLITASTNAAAKRVLAWRQPRASFRMMLLGAHAGLRRSEMEQLRWRDLDTSTAQAVVRGKGAPSRRSPSRIGSSRLSAASGPVERLAGPASCCPGRASGPVSGSGRCASAWASRLGACMRSGTRPAAGSTSSRAT